MTEQVNFSASGQQAPAANATAITPADSNLASDFFTRSIYVGGAGNLTVMMAGDDSIVTFSNIGAGTILPLRVKQIRSTATTATLIIALF